jgi:hypothetical protein
MKKLQNASMFASVKSVEQILNDLQPGLRIDEHELDKECQRHPELFQAVADELTFALSRRDEAKAILAEVEASVELDMRKKGRTEKLTNPEVAAMVCIDQRVRDAKRQHLRLAHEAARLSALKESFEQRSYQLKQMTQLYLASYFGDVSETGSTSQLKTVRSEYVKKELNRMRRGA